MLHNNVSSVCYILGLYHNLSDSKSIFFVNINPLTDHTAQHTTAGTQEKDGQHVAGHILNPSVDNE